MERVLSAEVEISKPRGIDQSCFERQSISQSLAKGLLIQGTLHCWPLPVNIFPTAYSTKPTIHPPEEEIFTRCSPRPV
jgi:hypothetical protein